MSNTNSLAADVHAALLRARAARDSIMAIEHDAVRALEMHLAKAPAAFDEAAAADALARAQFQDRLDGGACAAELQARQDAERLERQAALAAFDAERARLEGEVTRLQAEKVAADATIAEITSTRTAVVAKAASERQDAELVRYGKAVAALLQSAARIVALRTIATEPERDPRQARRFEGYEARLPSFGLDAIAGARIDGAYVACSGEVLATQAREHFNTLTDEICGVGA